MTERKYLVEPHIRPFAAFSEWEDKRVLEIGCGIGTDTLEFSKWGAHVDAVDISRESLRLAQMRACFNPLAERPNFLHMNAEENLPWTMGGYDLVYSFGVLHHLERPERVLDKAFHRLRKGGQLRIMLYARWSIKHLTGQQPEAQAGCPLVRWYSARQARRLVESAGFMNVKIRKAHIFPWNVAAYQQFRYVKRWPYSVLPASAMSWLGRHLGHHLLVTAERPAWNSEDVWKNIERKNQSWRQA